MEREGYAQKGQITLPSREKSQTGRGCLQLIIDVPGAEELLLCSELLWGCSINGISQQVLHGRWHRRARAIIFLLREAPESWRGSWLLLQRYIYPCRDGQLSARVVMMLIKQHLKALEKLFLAVSLGIDRGMDPCFMFCRTKELFQRRMNCFARHWGKDVCEFCSNKMLKHGRKLRLCFSGLGIWFGVGFFGVCCLLVCFLMLPPLVSEHLLYEDFL